MVSLTISCSNDASTEVVEGDYDAEDEDNSVGEEDSSFQVNIAFDIVHFRVSC